MSDKVTITTIAEECRVSPTTVSLVLNSKPGISSETRTRVIETAQRLGYKTVQFPISGKSTRISTFGIVVKTEPDLLPPSNPFYSQIIAGVDDACGDMGINLLFSMLPVDEDNCPAKIPPIIDKTMVSGILMVGTFIDQTIQMLFGKYLPPIVLVDGYSDTGSYDMVVSDNYGGAYQAVEHLVRLGHRHIGLIGGGPGCYPSICERRNGYFCVLEDNGIEKSYVADFNINKSQGEEETCRLLTENPQITAVFAVNDNIALGAMRGAQQAGRTIPQNFSIIGYDDTTLATSISPTLTTMRVDTLAMGRAAVHMLALRLEKPDAARATLVIHPTLVERESTQPLS